jgi:hypothetical protein
MNSPIRTDGVGSAHAWIRNNVFGLVAIFIALSGSAVAAQVSTHGGKAHTAKKAKSGPRGPAGPAGAAGPQGPAGPATGAAGGALSGDYPNPSIANGAVGASQLADGSVGPATLASPGGFTDAGLPHAGSACNTHAGSDTWANLDSFPLGKNFVSYFRDPYGTVHLRGVVCRIATPPTTTIFTLPSGDHPQFQEVMLRPASSGTTRIDINPDGTVVAPDLTDGNWVSLDGVSFSCAGSGGAGCPP